MNKIISMLVGGLALLTVSGGASALTLNFASSSQMTFNANDNTFTFGSINFRSLGLNGEITGSYVIGEITTSVFLEEAPVAGIGKLKIFDSDYTFSADVEFNKIYNIRGYGGPITGGEANLKNFLYGGSNPKLLELMNNQSGDIVITFQFVPPKTLADLTTGSGTHTTSYSGSISSVPIPSAAWLFGPALIGMIGVARRKNEAKRA